MSFILKNKEIDECLDRAKNLLKEGKIVEKTIPDYWCKGISDRKKHVTILFAVFLGIFAIDRLYLRKWISFATKLCVWIIVVPLTSLIWGLNSISQLEEFLPEYIIFSIILYGIAVAYYLGDIIISIKQPRDALFRCVINKK